MVHSILQHEDIDMDKKVIIVRECPGSGKTTFLKKNYPNAFICSAVNYFVDHGGNYKFYPTGLSESHKYCQSAFTAALQNNLPLVAVDNTNIKLWEFEWYVGTAERYGYEVVVFRMKVEDVNVVAQRNIHGVSIAKVLKMHSLMEDYPGEIFI